MFVINAIVDNKLSINFRVDKIKSIRFANKRKIKSGRKLNVKYENKTTFTGYISWLCFGLNFVCGSYDLKSID